MYLASSERTFIRHPRQLLVWVRPLIAWHLLLAGSQESLDYRVLSTSHFIHDILDVRGHDVSHSRPLGQPSAIPDRS